MAKTKFKIDVEKPIDITRINEKIRHNINKAKSWASIENAVLQSRYLIALSNTASWKKDLPGQLLAVKKRVKQEYCKTIRAANRRLKEIGIDHKFFSEVCKIKRK